MYFVFCMVLTPLNKTEYDFSSYFSTTLTPVMYMLFQI